MAVTSPAFQVEFFHLDVAFVPADRVVAAPGQVRGLAHGADVAAEDGIRALPAAAAALVAQIGKRPQHQAGESDDRPVHHPLPVAQGVRSWRSRGSQRCSCKALKVHRRGESKRAEAALDWANGCRLICVKYTGRWPSDSDDIDGDDDDDEEDDDDDVFSFLTSMTPKRVSTYCTWLGSVIASGTALELWRVFWFRECSS